MMAFATNLATVQLHDREICYVDIPGDGQPILLIHGIGGGLDDWHKVIPLLSERGHRVIAFDLPGHGGSCKSRGDYSLGALASVCRDLLEHLDCGPVVVVGHSLGGGIGLQFTYQFPEMSQSLALICSGGLGEEVAPWLRAASLPGSQAVFAGIGSQRTVSSLSWVKRSLSRFGIEPQTLTPEALERLSRFGDPATRTAFLATLRGVIDIRGQRVSALGKLSAIKTPVLIIWGASDPVVPVEHGYRAAEALPDCEFVVFPRIGHEPHIEDPDRVAELLAKLARSPKHAQN